jgi:Domain amino terminal to FKBP-type peptidyl-prolyl isomerase
VKKVPLTSLLLVVTLSVFSPSFAIGQQDLSYSFGMTLANTLSELQRANFSSEAFIEGLNDAQGKKTLKYSDSDVLAFTQKYGNETTAAARSQLISANQVLLSYCLGAGVGKAMISQGKQTLDSARVSQGLTDGIGRAKPQISDGQMNQAISDYGRSIASPTTAK